jgi:glycosyltransferase involved in cell wall biosynthesis
LAGVTHRAVLIIVENLPVPFDRRVWSQATALRAAGYAVSIICPKAKGYETSQETIDGIRIFRHPLPLEARGAAGYLAEYVTALFWEFVLSLKVWFRYGFDAIHACNPPDLIFLIGGFYKIFARKRFLFDHHDVNPELYEAKFGRRDLFWKVLLLAEKLTFRTADVTIATNQSYREIAISRGGKSPDDVFIVRSGPNLTRVRKLPPDIRWRNGRAFLVGYVGVIGEQEGIDLLLRAVRHIAHVRKRTDIQFAIVGAGPALAGMTEFCVELNLQDYVTFTGRVDDQALFTILSTADVCVNPDRVTAMNNISTMNKIMEYMALGKPIVQFDVIEGRYSARDASLYAKSNDPTDFGDRILELIDDPERRDRMGDFGRRRVETELAWEHEKPKLLAAYDRLFSQQQNVLTGAKRAER